MSTLVSPHVLRGAHVPAPRLPRLPHLRVVGPTGRRLRTGPGVPDRAARPGGRSPVAAPASSPVPRADLLPAPPLTPLSTPSAPHSAAPLARPLATPLRLTRRGRRVLGLALAAGIAVPALAGHLTTSPGTPVPAPAADSSGHIAASGVGASPWSAGSLEAERVAAGTAAPPTGWAVVTVLPGDSLWAIAGRSAAGTDRRDAVGRIVARNGLVGTEISAGDALLVPST